MVHFQEKAIFETRPVLLAFERHNFFGFFWMSIVDHYHYWITASEIVQ